MPALLACVLAGRAAAPVARRSCASPCRATPSSPGAGCSPTPPRPARSVGIVVSLAWAASPRALAYRLFMRRDFTDLAYDGSAAASRAGGAAPLAALLAVHRRGDRRRHVGLRLRDRQGQAGALALATAFAHLYRLQTEELHRPAVTEAQLRATRRLRQGRLPGRRRGPGNDWRCVVTWHLPGATATGSAIYQLDVTPDGRYVADGDGPQEVNGFFQVRTSTGDAPNPLWQFDGTVDLLDVPLERTDHAGHPPAPIRDPEHLPGCSPDVAGPGGWRSPASRPSPSPAARAYARTEVFGQNQVGTEYADGMQVSGDQIIKPLGERLLTQVGKFMGSTVSPDGRFLAATSTDRSVSLQIFDLSSYKLIWRPAPRPGQPGLTNSTVGQEGPTYSPDGKLLWLPQRTA